MKVQAKAGFTFAALDDSTAGEGLAIFFSQSAEDNTRWRCEVYAKLNTGQELLVGFFYISPPNATNPPGQLTRQVGAAVCPGAKSWSVVVSPDEGSSDAGEESADITLISSKCCTAPVGLTRVGQRYRYISGTTVAAQLVQLFSGQTVTGISAYGKTGGGSIVLGAGNTITVPEAAGVNLEPKAVMALPSASPNISFTNVSWLIELLESA